MSRHFIALSGCDIPSVTSHLTAYLLLGSLGKQEDQLWPICLFSCQSGKANPTSRDSEPSRNQGSSHVDHLSPKIEREDEGGERKRWKAERDKGNLP